MEDGFLETIYIINFLLCLVIFVLGFLAFSRSRNRLALFIAISFGLFGISHAILFLGCSGIFTGMPPVVTILAYLIIIFALTKQ
ncbi:MAG: hypothetical protein PHS09_05025 [Candidatus Omnitrophica bacterium]|nr:hypothetical protein [Candidatus Omnitrophota bacterium]